MKAFDRKSHWEKIYNIKSFEEVSWYQLKPQISLDFIEKAGISKDAAIIDIGGGDSFFVDYLLDLGFKDITVLDISETAIEKARLRLGDAANRVKWIVSDITTFSPSQKYDLWHDRAVFHFLTNKEDILTYKRTVEKGVAKGGYFLLGTFSDKGPEKCSGIPVRQYDREQMKVIFEPEFNLREFIYQNHKTPFNTEQSFVFGLFKRQ